MSRNRRFDVIAVLMLAGFAVAGCRENAAVGPAGPPAVATVEVSAPQLVLEVGEVILLHATPKSADGVVLERDVQWNSEDGARATVSAVGAVTGLAAGAVRILASSDGRTGSVELTVQEPEPPPVVEVILDVGTAELEVGETVWVGATAKLATGEIVERTVAWRSSADLVASVASSGAAIAAIDARSVGAAEITASIGTIEASVTIHVAPAPTRDLIYSTSRDGRREIFTLGLGAPSLPVRLNAGDVSSDPSPSPDGMQFVFAVSQTDAMGEPQHDLFVVHRDGMQMRQLTSAAGMEHEPAWSPDGERILFTASDAGHEGSNIWVVNVDGSGLQNLTASLPADVTNHRSPAWSPDGTRIAFVAARDAQYKIWLMDADGSNVAPITTDFGFDQSPTWSPTGDRIAFARYNHLATENGWDIVIVGVADGATTRLTLPGDQLSPAWSPDGVHIAVSGTARAGIGTHNIYTLRPDGTGLRLRTVDPTWGGGNTPAWITLR